MAFNRLDAEAELLRDVTRPMPFRHQPEHLDLTVSKGAQRAPRGECVADRFLKSARGRFENDVFGSGSYCGASLTADESPCNNYERRGWQYFAEYRQRGSRIELRE
jgi:hypothetical protein